TRYSLFGKRGIFRENQPVDFSTDKTNIERFNFAFAFNPKRLVMTRLFSFSAMTEIEIADNTGFNNDFNYNKYLAEFQFFSNFEPGSILKWRIRAGSITGEAPLFKQYQLGGIGSLRGSPFKIFTGNQMLLSNLEAQFGQIAKGRNDWIDFNSFYFTLFLDSGFVRESSSLRTSTNPFNDLGGFSFADLQHDIGAGLGTNLIRAELAWPLKRFGSTPAFWIRFNPTF
ncbi:MAG: BamA/TamA family outer membrane protein, partial [Balneolaceae bacterium]